jgi:hypothetical protein
MNSFNIIYKQCGKYSAIVYPVSYLNPIDDFQLISVELRKHLPAGCYVLFDLLLSNGDNFNRFAELYYNGEELSPRLISITEVNSNDLKRLNLYYRGKTKELSKSVLSPRERYKFATMK